MAVREAILGARKEKEQEGKREKDKRSKSQEGGWRGTERKIRKRKKDKQEGKREEGRREQGMSGLNGKRDPESSEQDCGDNISPSPFQGRWTGVDWRRGTLPFHSLTIPCYLRNLLSITTRTFLLYSSLILLFFLFLLYCPCRACLSSERADQRASRGPMVRSGKMILSCSMEAMLAGYW